MQLGYVILHVPDVTATVDFYERAFGLARRFVDAGGEYAEMETGATVLAFAAHTLLGKLGLPSPAEGGSPTGAEIALVTEEVAEGCEQALRAGATLVKAPARQPWGQTVGYVRDPNGFLVEICTPVRPA